MHGAAVGYSVVLPELIRKVPDPQKANGDETQKVIEIPGRGPVDEREFVHGKLGQGEHPVKKRENDQLL